MVWLTGLPCSGKSTIASRVAAGVAASGLLALVLDGDALRSGPSSDLGFGDDDRCEQAARTAHAARAALGDDGVVPIVALVSPLRRGREIARGILGPAMLEVFVDAPAAVCEARDVKGMYRRARRGELSSFTGVDAPYEPPEAPALHVETAVERPSESAERVLALLVARCVLPPVRFDAQLPVGR